MKVSKRILPLLLVLVMLMASLTACKARDGAVTESSSSSSSSSQVSRPEAKEGDEKVSSVIPDFLEDVAEKNEANTDTVGWLQVPNMGIEDVVVWNDKDNHYYERRNFDKDYSFNGIFYADRRSTFGDGSAEQLGVNTCIYGHALTDDMENKNYNIMFGPLHDFRHEDIAKETPYIFFTTEKENLAFEVFAVFTANTDNAAVPYNRNDIEPADFYKMVRDEILPRSIYNYDVDIKEGDKFLTLSTCIYIMPNGVPTNYPKTYYRYAIMARLVDPDEPLKKEASFTVNEDVLIDPAEKMS